MRAPVSGSPQGNAVAVPLDDLRLSPSESPSPEDGDQVDVLVHRLDPLLPLPDYAQFGDAGLDLCTGEDVRLGPGQRCSVPTGIAIALPTGYAGFVHPRSGLAARYGLTVLNAPGTVDAGYRGEIRVTLLNTDSEHDVQLRRGDRIAQLVVQQVSRARLIEVGELPASARGTGGFGSTGGFDRSTVRGSTAPERGEI